MKRNNRQMARFSTTVLGLLAAAVLMAAGCDKSGGEGGDQASSETPQPTEAEEKRQAGSPSDDTPTAPGGAEKGDKPSPSAGTEGSEDKPGSAKKPGSAGKPSAGGNAPSEGGGDISDEDLEKFAEVTAELKPKRQELKKSLDEAETPSEAKKAQKEVMEATREAAEDVGLGFEKFRAISRQAQRDPELQKRIREKAAESAAESEGN